MLDMIIALCFALAYAALQLYYLWHWLAIPVAHTRHDDQSLPRVSVIIVAHNEEKTIDATLSGLFLQKYPQSHFEIIVIDDHSTDTTAGIVKKYISGHARLFHLDQYPEYIRPPAYKKSGITLAVDKAAYEHIVVTDGDCVQGENWLASVMQHFREHNATFQAAPVMLQGGGSLLEKMQEAEGLALMAVTGAGIYSGLHDLANGANMAFTKSAFREVRGYDGNFHIASGDDLFLIEKMRSTYPDRVKFIKSAEATVYTSPKKTWEALLQQRLRWAGKNNALQSKATPRIWMFVGVYHVLTVGFLIPAIFNMISFWPVTTLLLVKWLGDFTLMYAIAGSFRKRSLLWYFIPLQLFYGWYVLRMGLAMATGKKGDWARRE